MKPSTYRVASDTAGALYVMPRPSSDWLEEDIGTYRSLGIDKIVSLLTPEEAADLGLQQERVCCETEQIDYFQFPISDRGLPDSPDFLRLVTEVCKALADGSKSPLAVGVAAPASASWSVWSR